METNLYQHGRTALALSMYAHAVPQASATSQRIGRILMDRKSELRYSAREIAETSGLSESSVNRYLRGGREINIDDLQKLCRALRLDPLAVFAEATHGRVQP